MTRGCASFVTQSFATGPEESGPALRRRRLRRCLPAADPDRLDAVLAHRLDPDRIAVGGDLVPAFGQPAELGEDESADRVVRVRVDGEMQSVVLQIGHRDVTADVPLAAGET